MAENVLRDIKKEYAKFKLKFGSQKSVPEEPAQMATVTETQTTIQQKQSSENGAEVETVTIVKKTFTEKMTDLSIKAKNLPHSDSFVKFREDANKQFAELDSRLQNFWKKPEPLTRPPELNLTLIGVALFKGNEFISKAIRKFTKSRYSHVALLLKDVNFADDNDPEGWYIYSANGSASQILDQHRFPQVQLEKWTDIVKDYDGAAGTRVILFEDSRPDPAQVTELVDKYLGLPYETQVLVMLKAVNRTNEEAEGHAASAFCSEICYRFLVALGILDDCEIPENVWPKDFSDENEKLALKKARWGDIVAHKGRFLKTIPTDETVAAVVTPGASAEEPSSVQSITIQTQSLSHSSF